MTPRLTPPVQKVCSWRHALSASLAHLAVCCFGRCTNTNSSRSLPLVLSSDSDTSGCATAHSRQWGPAQASAALGICTHIGSSPIGGRNTAPRFGDENDNSSDSAQVRTAHCTGDSADRRPKVRYFDIAGAGLPCQLWCIGRNSTSRLHGIAWSPPLHWCKTRLTNWSPSIQYLFFPLRTRARLDWVRRKAGFT